jgi:hypothetical protein
MRVTRSSAPGQSELFQHISILRSMSAALAKQFAAILLIGARYSGPHACSAFYRALPALTARRPGDWR